MESWIFFAFIAQLLWALCSLIDKFVISRGHIKNPFVYIILNGLMNALVILMVPFFKIESLSMHDFLIALGAEIILFSAVMVYYKAVQYEEISRVAILYQIGPIFVLMLSLLFIGEKLTKNHFIGFLLLLIAGLVVSLKIKTKFTVSKALPLMVLSMFMGSIGIVMVKYVYNIASFWSAFFSSSDCIMLPATAGSFVTLPS